MRETFDFNKEYGIVLEGGGAKGAYQIGAWKAFIDCGLKIKGVSGVSVGALNGALICMGDYEKAVDIWKNISYSKIMRVDDYQMDKLIKGKFRELSLQEVSKSGRKFLVDGGLDVTPLKEMIDATIDEKRIRESDIEFIMETFSISNMKEVVISAKEAEEGYLKDYLLASANFPLFKSERLLGKKFLDGGIVNNVPIDLLIDRGYKDIIVIRIYGIGMEKKVKIPEDVNISYLAPRTNLCNILEFNNKKAARNISLGYYDAMRMLYSLAGYHYYIDSTGEEKDYLGKLSSIDENMINQLAAYFKKEASVSGSGLRILTESIYPLLAAKLKLGKSWLYTDLYFSILEYCAKKLRIKRFKIYTEEEFYHLIKKGLEARSLHTDDTDIIVELAKNLLI